MSGGNMTAGAEDQKVIDARALYATFLANNTYSKIEARSETQPTPVVRLPWGDTSLTIVLPDNRPEFAAALNACILPERFAALWHVETRDLECIYTAYALKGTQEEVADRRFTFAFKGKEYECEFGPSSDRLLLIAELTFPTGPSTTQYRHLGSFHHYVMAKKGSDDYPQIQDGAPVSFWIRKVEVSEVDAVELARHLNFYMTYFDIHNPTIDILPPKQEVLEDKPRERYISGKFPTKIVGTTQEPSLLHYWMTARTGDAFRKYLYCYQILEYVAFYYIDDSIKKRVKRLLITPDFHDKIDDLMMEILESLQDKKIWDGDKIDRLLQVAVNPKLLWTEIAKNKDHFNKAVKFDGGFTMENLITDKDTEDTFCATWHNSFAAKLRKIRNALSHAKEQSMESVITPTNENFKKLQPWHSLISIAAGEVMVYHRAAF